MHNKPLPGTSRHCATGCIRRTQTHESELLSDWAFRSKAYWGYSSEFMAACREELTYRAADLKPGLFYIIQNDAIPVGFCGLSQASESVFEREALFVLPDCIGKAYGRQLMEHAKRTATQLGITKLMIQGHPNARVLYLQIGGELLGERESDSIPGRFLPLSSVALKP